jgi:hypothetical protein
MPKVVKTEMRAKKKITIITIFFSRTFRLIVIVLLFLFDTGQFNSWISNRTPNVGQRRLLPHF